MTHRRALAPGNLDRVRAGVTPLGRRCQTVWMFDSGGCRKVRGWLTAERIGLGLALLLLAIQAVPGLWARSLWLDEGYTRAAVDDLGNSMSATPGQMPAFYGFMAIWGKAGIDAWWLRMPSLLAAAGALYMTSRIARRVAGPTVAAVTPVILAAIPMFAVKSVEARPYMVELFLVTVAWYGLLRLSEVSRRASGLSRPLREPWYWALVTIAIVGPGIHGLFVTQFLALTVYVTLFRDRGVEPRFLALPTVACLGVTGVLYQVSREHPSGALNLQPLGAAIREAFLSAAWPVGIVVLVLAVFGGRYLLRRLRVSQNGTAAVPLIWVLVPLVLLLVTRAVFSVYDPRYLTPIAPAVAILVAAGFVQVVAMAFRSTTPSRRLLVPAAFALAGIMAISSAHPSIENAEDWNGAARVIADHGRSRDAVVFGSSTGSAREFRPPFEAAWTQLESSPSVVVLSPPRPFGQVRRKEPRLAVSTIAERALSHPRVWIISYGDPDKGDLRRSARFTRNFEEIGRWDFAGWITVELYRRS